MIQLSTRNKQALLPLFLVGAILFLLLATNAFALGEPREDLRSKPRKIQASVYDEYVKAKPATPTTTVSPPVKPSVSSTKPQNTSTVSVAKSPPSTSPGQTQTTHGTTRDVWEALRNCEAGGNYATNTGNGYYGAYQFSAATWRSMGTAYDFAHEAPPEVQDDAARRLQARSGWGQWPACSKKLGLR